MSLPDLAHSDLAVCLVQRLVEIALFFHPAVWFVSRRVTVEREHCCDDLVLQCGSEPCCYAESLVRLSELRHEAAGLSQESGAALAATDGGGTRLRQRILRILGQTEGGPNMQLTSRSLIVFLGLLGVALMGFASLAILGLALADESAAATDGAGQPAAKRTENDEAIDVGSIQRTTVKRYLSQLEDEDWLIRQASIEALAELKNPRHLTFFIDALDDENPQVRSAAVYALRSNPDRRAVEPLLAALKRVEGRFPIQNVIYALQAIGEDRAVEPVLQTWQKHRETLDPNVLRAYRDSEDPHLNDHLWRHLRLKNGRIDRNIAGILVYRNDPRVADALAEELSLVPTAERHLVADLLARLRDPRALAPLLTALRGKDIYIRRAAIQSLGKLGDRQAVPAIIDVGTNSTTDWDGWKTRERAAEALAAIGGEQAIAAVLRWASDCEISWRYRTGYVEALGASDDPGAVAALIDLAGKDDDVYILEAVAEALQKVGDERAGDALKRLAEHVERRVRRAAEPAYADVRLGASAALRQGDTEQAFKLASAGLRDDDEAIVRAAIRALARVGDDRSVNLLIEKIGDTRQPVRYEIYSSLKWIDNPRAVEGLVRLLSDPDDKTRFRAARVLASRSDRRAIDPLLDLSQHKSEYYRRQAASELRYFRNPRVVRRLCEMLADEDYHVRKDAARTLSYIADRSALDAVLKALGKAAPSEQRAPLVRILGRIDDPRCIARLEQLLADEDYSIRSAAARSLARLGWKPRERSQRLRYLAATGRRAELEAVVPPATPVDKGRVAGDFQLNAPITARLTVGTPEWPIVVSTGSVEFTQAADGLTASVQVFPYSYPYSKWRVQVDLFDAQRRKLATAGNSFQTSGIIITVRMSEGRKAVALKFGAVAASKVKRFELSVKQVFASPKPGVPVVKTSPAFEAPIAIGKKIEAAVTSATARGETIFRVGDVEFSMGNADSRRRTVNARLVLRSVPSLQAEWRLWMIFLDDKGNIHSRGGTRFKTRRRQTPDDTDDVTALTFPMTVGTDWKADGRFRFGVELIPPSPDDSAKQLALADAHSVPADTVALSYVDDSAESKKSIAASGHAVRFERSAEDTFVEAIQFFGSRYGTSKPPKDDFHVYLLNEQFQVLADLKHPYALIPRGDMTWHTLRTPSIEVPQVFHVALAFNPHRTKGIYLGLDESVPVSHSMTGLVGDGFSKWKAKSDWMVRVRLAQKPTGARGIQKLADWKPPKPPQDPFVGTIEVRNDDGKSAGKQSYGGAGPVIRIPLDKVIPEGTDIKDVMLKGLRIYGSRYGSGFDPEKTKFHVDIVDAHAKPLWKQDAPYSLFGYKPRWVDILFDKPVPVAEWLANDQTLTVGVDPEAHQRKGIYFHYSKPAEGQQGPGGFVPGKRFFKAADRQWMIRAYLLTERNESH